MKSRAEFIAKLNARTVREEGTDVRLAGGAVLRAVIVHGDHELIRELQAEQDSPEKRPVVFVFAGDAWGAVIEGMSLSVGGDVVLPGQPGQPRSAGKDSKVAMERRFIVAAPLHPKWQNDVVTELAVAAYPDN